MIKGKTAEEIRRTFNITNDFTPEEEAQIKKENVSRNHYLKCNSNSIIHLSLGMGRRSINFIIKIVFFSIGSS